MDNEIDSLSTTVNSEGVIDVINPFSANTIFLLSGGLIDLYKPSLTNINQQLKELTAKQSVLVEQLHDENLKISWAKNGSEINDMFNIIKNYQGKLCTIKKDMRLLHDKSAKLKKRAIRLQQYKEREIVIKTQQMQHEEDLVVKHNEK